MIDLVLAKKLLKIDDCSIAIVKTHLIIYRSKRKGIFPIYDAVTSPSVNIQGASVADKVTGKGAALLCAYGKIGYLYSDVISKPALKVLMDNGIEVSYGELVDYIKNRNGDGRCPVETLADDIERPEDIIKPVKKFLTEIGLL